MALQQVTTSVSNLIIGMYVAELDRPWVDTPFPLQGFYVTSYDDIRELQNYCHHVQVDVERSEASTHHMLQSQPRPAGRGTRPKAAPLKKRPNTYRASKSLRQELPKAVRIHEKLTAALDRAVAALRAGHPLAMAEIRKAVSAMVKSIVRNPDALVWLAKLREQDEYSYSRSLRSATWALVFGRHLGLAEDAMEDLALAVLLSDIGVTRLPADLVTKAGPRSGEERALMRKHVEYSVQILQHARGTNDRIVATVAAHHERFDGSGYPRGLRGDAIPYLSKIAGIVGRYESLRSPRRPRRGLSPADAMAKLYESRDCDFQQELVDEFIQAVGIYPAGTLVELTSREIGIVVAQNRERRLRPQIMLVMDKDGQPLPKPRLLDLCKQRQSNSGHPLKIERSLRNGDHNVDIKKISDSSFASRWPW